MFKSIQIQGRFMYDRRHVFQMIQGKWKRINAAIYNDIYFNCAIILKYVV